MVIFRSVRLRKLSVICGRLNRPPVTLIRRICTIVSFPQTLLLESFRSEDQIMEENLDVLSILQKRLPPFSKLLGIKFLSTTPERVVGEMLVRDELCTMPEILHGGALMSFADTLGACATVINLHEGFGTTT